MSPKKASEVLSAKKRFSKFWQDEKGEHLSSEKIKEVSQNWSANVWEAYLKSLEFEQREVVTGRYDILVSRYCPSEEDTPDCAEQEVSAGSPELRISVANLPAIERAILDELFVFMLSERETAEKLGLKRWLVRNKQKSAMKNIRAALLRKRE